MADTNQDNAEQTSKEEPKHNKSGRVALALAFSWVGAKLGILGLAADTSSLLKGKPKTLRSMKETLTEQLEKDIAAGNSTLKTQFRVMKYTTILTFAGMAAGAVLGWVRGNRIESTKDIFHHPIHSLKLMFSKKQEKPETTDKSAQDTTQATPESSAGEQRSSDKDKSSNWTQRTSAEQETVQQR